MKPPPFAYLRPGNVGAAVEALQDPDAKVIAGGQSLVPMLAMRLARPAVLVDINGLDELARIEHDAGRVRIGAAVRQRDVEQHAGVANAVPLLPAALRWVGHREIRNRGTVVGSIAHADPAAELPCVAVTLGAVLTVVGPGGTRQLAAEDAFAGPFETVIDDSELITHVSWPARSQGDGFAFHEVARRHGDFALCGAAAHVRVDHGEARVGLLGMGSTPVLLDASALLVDDPEARKAEVRRLAATLTPGEDMHASAGYRRRLAATLIERAVNDARTDASSPADHDREWTAPSPSPRPSTASFRRGGDPGVVRFSVNGMPLSVTVEPRTTLADALRQRLRLTGTHLGCEHGVCGACTVMVDGRAQRSCLLFAMQMEGAEILTVEGLGRPDDLHPLQEAFREHHGLQCGFCTPGFLMSSYELLSVGSDNHDDAEQLAGELSGVLCRCTGYRGIVRAVQAVGRQYPDGLPPPRNLDETAGVRTVAPRSASDASGASGAGAEGDARGASGAGAEGDARGVSDAGGPSGHGDRRLFLASGAIAAGWLLWRTLRAFARRRPR